MIKVLLISIDQTIKLFIQDNYKHFQFITFNSTKDPLDIMSQVCITNPSVLIFDDDFTSPNSEHLLNSIKKVNPKLPIIFLTSNSSLEFGRIINSIGVTFYLIKPLSNIDFYEFLKSSIKEKTDVIF
ncbi:MAG: hypothetical protein H6609_07535 [Ignavibacteriales bacterium]|nr:hypothetical protein [Ignavibacteriales bacterium]